MIHIPVSIGELYDKYSILQIKEVKIKDEKKLEYLNKELFFFKEHLDKYNLDIKIYNKLKILNESLWEIEDKIRDKERMQDFGSEFIELARNVYITNDKRCKVKNEINQIFNSEFYEIKSYSKYESLPNMLKELKELKEIKIGNSIGNTEVDIELIELYKSIIEKASYSNINKYYKELGELYESQLKFYDAVGCYVKILTTEKKDLSMIGVLSNQIGVCYYNISQHKLAIHYFKKVLIIKEIPDVYCNIGLCFMALKNYKESETNLLKSYNIDSNERSAFNLGQLYYYLKQYDKSIQYYKKNKMTDAHAYSLSFTHLAKREFKIGFQLYEYRLTKNEINKQTNLVERVDVQLPYWDGVDKCETLLIIAEQGLGDNIQYYRFIIELSEKYPSMKICYFCKKEIAHLFKTYNNIEIIHEVIIMNFNFKLYIMSLPKILSKCSIEPNKINYIKTNESKLIEWKEKLSHLNRRKVGFVYNGLLSSFIEKNIPLKEFEILAELDIDLICIHKKSELEKDLEQISFKNKITYFDIDVDIPFEDTIHLLQNIDLLITIDTYIVHLAGIMNINTWLLLGKSEWRWSYDPTSTYWYNSVKLIRTNETNTLPDLLKVVKTNLMNPLCIHL